MPKQQGFGYFGRKGSEQQANESTSAKRSSDGPEEAGEHSEQRGLRGCQMRRGGGWPPPQAGPHAAHCSAPRLCWRDADCHTGVAAPVQHNDPCQTRLLCSCAVMG